MEDRKVQELLNLVKRNYQEIAADFDVTRKKEIWPEIREFAEQVKTSDKVLDLGCGNGRLLEAFSDKTIDYLGLDNSAELIKLAETNYPDKKFIVGDVLDLKEVADNYYDYIFCLATLQHIPGRELRLKALQEMAGKLKNGGKLIISNWNLWSQKKHRRQLIKNYWLKLIGRCDLGYNDIIFPWKNAQGEEKSIRYYHAFAKKELKKLARLTNLPILELKRDKYNFWLVLNKK